MAGRPCAARSPAAAAQRQSFASGWQPGRSAGRDARLCRQAPRHGLRHLPGAAVTLDDYLLASLEVGWRITRPLEAYVARAKMRSTPTIRTCSAIRRREGRSMRAFAFALAISLALAGAAQAAPRRVASLNLCTDELLLLLARPEQIVSVTHLAQKPGRNAAVAAGAALPPQRRQPGLGGRPAPRSGADHGRRRPRPGPDRRAARHPDRSTCPFRRASPISRQAIAQVAAALGRPRGGGADPARIDGLRRSAPRAPIDTVWLGGGGRSVAADGLGGGMDGACRASASAAPGRPGLARAIAGPPAGLAAAQPVSQRPIFERADAGWPIRWPAARAARAASRPTAGRWTCMGPLMIAEIARLRGEAGAMSRAVSLSARGRCCWRLPAVAADALVIARSAGRAGSRPGARGPPASCGCRAPLWL